ncbi:spheroidene monooxygenase [Jannaschia donghaensis]|uniref:Spheroidene monooxygenase n=1 Tax=Jannaschia donghaensis TaxID=420998 RepID=A0A0M6YCG5_9RHOB|nr:hypothetical protein [Jannaschia donghaensis]CTQ48051.1 Spheroidene monooxygenase [Jannaschia donghaensis]
MTQVVSLSFFRFGPWRARAWALTQMGLARGAMGRIPDVGFWKLCGSGTGEGFTPLPNTAVYAILATWPDLETAKTRIEEEMVFRRYRDRAAEDWTVFLSPTSARGAWSGVSPFSPAKIAPDGPLAVLTRATVRPGIVPRFWTRVPDISRVIGRDPNVLFKIGIGEVPWLHQVTFSIWPDAASVTNFARTGPHGDAIRAVRKEGWFREELYARFAVADERGTWDGRSPLERTYRSEAA